jgi:hypothetical protein
MRQELIARIDRNKAYDYFLRTQGWGPDVVDAQVLTALDQKDIMGSCGKPKVWPVSCRTTRLYSLSEVLIVNPSRFIV